MNKMTYQPEPTRLEMVMITKSSARQYLQGRIVTLQDSKAFQPSNGWRQRLVLYSPLPVLPLLALGNLHHFREVHGVFSSGERVFVLDMTWVSGKGLISSNNRYFSTQQQYQVLWVGPLCSWICQILAGISGNNANQMRPYTFLSHAAPNLRYPDSWRLLFPSPYNGLSTAYVKVLCITFIHHCSPWVTMLHASTRCNFNLGDPKGIHAWDWCALLSRDNLLCSNNSCCLAYTALTASKQVRSETCTATGRWSG